MAADEKSTGVLLREALEANHELAIEHAKCVLDINRLCTELAEIKRQWAADVEALIAARQETEQLAEDNDRLREENAALRRQIHARGHAYHLTEKGLAALQADTKEKK